jgi:DNA polymerase-3 subunit epsilon
VQRSFDDLGTPLADVTFCVLDIETTGSDRGGDLITEIGVVKVRRGEFLGTMATLVNPGKAIAPSVTVLTGITQSMVAKAPRIETVLPTLQEFVGDSVIVGHNVSFDMGFINAALLRSDRPAFRNTVIDTLPLARRLVRDEVPDCRLGTLASRFRLDHKPTHRALDDALATTDLLHLLLERAAGLGVLGLDDLVMLPKMGGHPQAGKLKLTHHLPRSPGVYRFLGANDEVLYVGKATNLRQRVRSYFGSDDRRKIGPMLRETQRLAHTPTSDPVSAEVLELRYLHRLNPRYNRVGTTWQKYCYVRLTTDEAWPRLVITNEPAATGVHLGPLSSRSAAATVIEAIQSALPHAPLHHPHRCQVPAAGRRHTVHGRPSRCRDVPMQRHRQRSRVLAGSGPGGRGALLVPAARARPAVGEGGSPRRRTPLRRGRRDARPRERIRHRHHPPAPGRPAACGR